jgi:two-component system response regulator NreC
VIGDANNGIEAMEKVRTCNPDIVLLDITMPKLNGIDTLKQIMKASKKTNVIILTMHANDQYIHEALASGANGYVLKESASEDLIAAIRAVARGEAYLSPTISKKLITHYIKDGKKAVNGDSKYESLTQREKEILKMVSQELTTRQIAKVLFLSIRTVENHRNNIMKKLDIHSKAGLIKYAIQSGLVEI